MNSEQLYNNYIYIWKSKIFSDRYDEVLIAYYEINKIRRSLGTGIISNIIYKIRNEVENKFS